jgi:hypothetical protein
VGRPTFENTRQEPQENGRDRNQNADNYIFDSHDWAGVVSRNHSHLVSPGSAAWRSLGLSECMDASLALLRVGAAMPIRTLIQSGAFDPEAIAAITEAFDAACKKLGDIDQPEVAREVIAGRIIAAARFGERDPIRLLEAALRKSD